MDRTQDMPALLTIFEGLGQHFRAAIGTGDFKTILQQPHRVKTGSGRHIQHLPGAVFLQYFNEEIAFAAGTAIPIDKLVPFINETGYVFVFVMIRITDLQGI